MSGINHLKYIDFTSVIHYASNALVLFHQDGGKIIYRDDLNIVHAYVLSMFVEKDCIKSAWKCKISNDIKNDS